MSRYCQVFNQQVVVKANTNLGPGESLLDLPYIKRILKEHLKLVELSVNTRVPLPFETIEFYRLLVSNHGSKYIRDQGIAPKMAKVAKHYYTETVTDDTLSAGVLIELAWFFNLLSTGNEKKSQVKLDNAVLIETLHELLDFEYSCDSVKLHCIWGLRNIAANMAIFGVVGFEMLGYSFATDGTDDKADQALNYLMDFLEGPIASVFEETVMAQDSLANHRTCTCIDDATDASTTFLAMRPGVARNEGVHMVWLATLEQGVACMKNVATWQPMPKEPLLIFIDVVAVLLDQTYKSVSLLSDCCAFLALITERGDTDMRDRLLAAGILSKIKRHFYKGQNLSVVSSILRLIGNLIFAGEKNGKLPSPGTTDCIGVIIDLGYVPLLFSVLDWYPNGQLENLQMRKDALWAISNMCAGTSRHVLSVLAHKGALVTLVTLLKDDPDCHQESAWAIMAACLSDSRFIKFFFNGKPDFLDCICEYIRCHLAEMYESAGPSNFGSEKEFTDRSRTISLSLVTVLSAARQYVTGKGALTIAETMSFVIVNTPSTFSIVSDKAQKVVDEHFPNMWTDMTVLD